MLSLGRLCDRFGLRAGESALRVRLARKDDLIDIDVTPSSLVFIKNSNDRVFPQVFTYVPDVSDEVLFVLAVGLMNDAVADTKFDAHTPVAATDTQMDVRSFDLERL